MTWFTVQRRLSLGIEQVNCQEVSLYDMLRRQRILNVLQPLNNANNKTFVLMF
jgi:hypothetical protein